MSSSHAVKPASHGAVALGVALLFGCGSFGFYMLSEVTRPDTAPSPPRREFIEELEERAPESVNPAPAPTVQADLDADPVLADPDEQPGFPPDPTAIANPAPER
jgi:hypothetical protein